MALRMGCSSSKSGKRSAAGGKLSALVVDDDALIRRIHTAILNRCGLETKVAGNGKEAVDFYSSGSSFHLVLMDMEMPVMDGPKATRELRAMGVDSIIVGMTSRDKDSERNAFMAAGLDHCYVKPLKAETINSLLQELNNRH